MKLSSLIQARLAYAGMFVGLYVGVQPLTLSDDYGSAVPIDAALLNGGLAGLAGALFAAMIFAMWFRDRFWEVMLWALPVALPLGVLLSLLERDVRIFLGQPLLYAALGMLVGAVLGFWLNLLLCAWRPGRACACCTPTREERS